MAKCAFLGMEEVYERDLYARLVEAAGEVVREEEEVDFLLLAGWQFARLCLDAAQEVKQHHPEKAISVQLVAWEAEEVDLARRAPGMQVSLLTPALDPPKRAANGIARRKKLERWLASQADYVISYFYPMLFADTSGCLALARRRGCKILDGTSEETAAFLQRELENVPAKSREILYKVLKGETRKAAGAARGISGSAAQQLLNRGSADLRRALRSRLRAEAAPPLVCSVFSLGKADFATMQAMERAAAYLVGRGGPCRFYVLWESCQSGYMHVLCRLAEAHKEVELIGVTHNTQEQQAAWEAAWGQAPLPCQKVEHLGGQGNLRTNALAAVKTLMHRSDFCITNLASGVFRREVERHLPKTLCCKLLDIGKRETGAL